MNFAQYLDWTRIMYEINTLNREILQIRGSFSLLSIKIISSSSVRKTKHQAKFVI